MLGSIAKGRELAQFGSLEGVHFRAPHFMSKEKHRREVGAFLCWLRGPESNRGLEVMRTTITFVTQALLDLLVWTIPSSVSFERRCLPSSLYTFPPLAGLARYCHVLLLQANEGFTEFGKCSIKHFCSMSPLEPPEVPLLYPAMFFLLFCLKYTQNSTWKIHHF